MIQSPFCRQESPAQVRVAERAAACRTQLGAEAIPSGLRIISDLRREGTARSAESAGELGEDGQVGVKPYPVEPADAQRCEGPAEPPAKAVAAA